MDDLMSLLGVKLNSVPSADARLPKPLPLDKAWSQPAAFAAPAESEGEDDDSDDEDFQKAIQVRPRLVTQARLHPFDTRFLPKPLCTSPAAPEGCSAAQRSDRRCCCVQASLIETRLPAADMAAARPAAAGAQVSDVATPGLQNDAGEYNCFLNCIIQCLWHCQEFRQHVQRWAPAQVEVRLPAARGGCCKRFACDPGSCPTPLGSSLCTSYQG